MNGEPTTESAAAKPRFRLSEAHAYAAGVALAVAALFIPKLLPCVDYPQHLALSDLVRRLESPDAAAHATHLLNLFTYNGLFHLLVANLSRVLPIELAGRIVVALSLVLLSVAVRSLLRLLGRPPAYAALFTPLLFSSSVAWGFVNYALGTALGALTLVAVVKTLQRPKLLGVVAIAGFGLLCAYAHVLAMLVLCLTAACLAPELAWRNTNASSSLRHAARAFLRSVTSLAPLLVGSLFCIAVYRQQYWWAPSMYRDPSMEGAAPPIWKKLLYFSAYATNLHVDRTDQLLLLLALGTLVFAVVQARRGSKDPSDRPLLLPFFALALAYLATPMVLVGTHLIFPRLAQTVVLGALLAAPRLAGVAHRRVTRFALGLGLASGANLMLHCALFAWETNAASRVIDTLPPGRAASAVIYGAQTFSFRPGVLVYLQGYYAARKQGLGAFSFARYLSLPVRFRPGTQAPWPQRSWEFTPGDYNPGCRYARSFDLLILKAPRDLPTEAAAEPLVRARVFGVHADQVKLLGHEGSYWAFDTKDVPNDGTF